MARKKQMEGDTNQRRRKARSARNKGDQPSSRAVTTGASKQRSHKSRRAGPIEKLRSIRRGKQRVIGENTPEPNPGSGRHRGNPAPRRPASRSARPSARRQRKS